MRKNTVIVGVVILAVGIIMAGGGWVVLTHSLTSTLASSTGQEGSTMYAGQNGDFYSNLLTASLGSDIIVSSNSSNVHPYLIPSGDLPLINSGNIENYSIAASTTQGNDFAYSGLNGTYCVVTFGTSSPNIAYIVVSHFSSLVMAFILLGLGVIIVVAGIIMAIIGAVRKPKNSFKGSNFMP